MICSSLSSLPSLIRNPIRSLMRAGHEPSLLGKRDEDGNFEVSKLHGGGMALGMVPPELFEEMIEDCESSFERNDMLVLYTDGVTRSRKS